MTVETWFPKAHKAHMIRQAHEHAELYGIEIGQDRSVSDDARAVVNWLRHEHTDYDIEQTYERHKIACEAIAEAFPWLAEECSQQIKRRREADRRAADEAAQHEAEQEHWKAARRARVEDSKQAIKGMTVGQQVTYWHNEKCSYAATIIKVGRSKVTVAYQVKTGKDRDRTATVHAALVMPLGSAV